MSIPSTMLPDSDMSIRNPVEVEVAPTAEEAPDRDQWGQYEHTIRFKDLDWTITLGIFGLHAAALLAPFFFSWSGVVLAIFLWWAVGGLGITLCYHRLLTHRSF